MDKLCILEKLVRNLYEKRDKRRADWSDWMYENHVFVVSDYGRVLAHRLGANYEVVVAAALLHDIADSIMPREDKNHELESINIAKNFLIQSQFSKEDINLITEDILPYHSCYNGITPKSHDGRVMASADATAHFMTDFYDFAQQKFLERGQTIEEFNKWMLPKLEKDYKHKICFDEVRAIVTKNYLKLKNSCKGNYAFIDAQNLYRGLNSIGRSMDYKAFRIYLSENFNVSRAFIFIGRIAENEKIYKYYRKCDFEIVFKDISRDNNGKPKGNVDTELVLFASAIKYNDYGKAVIVSSDGDFACLVNFLKTQGKFRAVISPEEEKCSYLLKKAVGGRITYIERILQKVNGQVKRRA